MLLDDQAVKLRAERIDLKNVRAATVVIRIDQDFEVIIQILAYVAPQFTCDDSQRLGIKAVNPEIDSVARIENAYFRSFRSRLSFVRFLLAKLRNRFRGLPERIVQRPIELRSVIDANGLHRV